MGGLLNSVMMAELKKTMDVAEVYSPPRGVEMARKPGFRAGWSLDLTTMDEEGRPWDFNQVHMRNMAVRKLLSDKPRLLIRSPMCTALCSFNNINYKNMNPEEVQQRVQYGRQHLEFCTKLYELQWKEGRYLLHEHPQAVTSWNEKCMTKLLEKVGVQRVVGDQCVYGLKIKDGDKAGLARKRTGSLTNSPCIAQALSKRCPNTWDKKVHEHIRLEPGRTKAAQEYPPELCHAICKGLKAQMGADRKGHFLIAELEGGNGNNGGDLKKTSE